MSMESSELLTIDEVTELTSLSRMTLWRTVRDGDLEQVVVPGSGRNGAKRIPRRSLAALFARCTVRPEQTKEDAVAAQTEPDRLIPLKEFALANKLPWRGLAQAARDGEFEHVLFNGRRYVTPEQGDAFMARFTVPTAEKTAQSKEQAELAAERERIDRSRARRSRRSTPSRSAA